MTCNTCTTTGSGESVGSFTMNFYRKLWLSLLPFVFLTTAISLADALDAEKRTANWLSQTVKIWVMGGFIILMIETVGIMSYYQAKLYEIRNAAAASKTGADSSSNTATAVKTPLAKDTTPKKKAAAAAAANDDDDGDAVVEEDDDDPGPSQADLLKWRSVRLLDCSIDLLFLIFAWATIMFVERHVAYGTPSWPFVLWPIYLAAIVYVALLINATIRTSAERRIESPDNCCIGTFGGVLYMFREQNHRIEVAAADMRAEKHTDGAPAIAVRYNQRAEYQDDPRVYVLTSSSIPLNRVAERAEALFGWCRLLLFGLLLVFITVWLVQSDAASRVSTMPPLVAIPVPPPGQEAAAENGVKWSLDDAAEHYRADMMDGGAVAGIVHFVSPLQNRTALNERISDVNRRILKSLETWRTAHVVPAVVVMIPLFIWQLVFFLHTIPTAYSMMRNRSSFRQWCEWLIAHAEMVLFVIFEIVLAAHIDDHLLEHRSWHATFAPLYCALTLRGIWAELTTLVFPERALLKRTVVSRWGLLVFGKK